MKLKNLLLIFGKRTTMADKTEGLTPQIITNWGDGDAPSAWRKPLKKAVKAQKRIIDKAYEELMK